jgi:hypothetical protein
MFKGRARAVRIAHRKASIWVLFGVALVAIVLASICRRPFRLGEYLLALAVLLVLPGAVMIGWREVAGEVRHLLLQPDVRGKEAIRIFGRAVWLAVALVMYVKVIYPIVPQAYGGGNHTHIQICATDEGAKMLRDVGFAPEPAQPHIFSAELICEDAQYLTVVAPSTTLRERAAVRLRRDQVMSMTTRPLRPAEAATDARSPRSVPATKPTHKK